MTRFTIVLAVLVALANIQSNVVKAYSDEEIDPWKDALFMRILNAKNHAFDQMQSITMTASIKTDEFIKRVNIIVEEVWLKMAILKQKSGNTNPVCDKAKDDINVNALKTISHYQSCVSKVLDNVDWDFQSMSSDTSTLTKDIHAAESVNEELYSRTAEIEVRSKQFGPYMAKLGKCDANSNFPRLKRQISEALTSYTQCLNTK